MNKPWWEQNTSVFGSQFKTKEEEDKYLDEKFKSELHRIQTTPIKISELTISKTDEEGVYKITIRYNDNRKFTANKILHSGFEDSFKFYEDLLKEKYQDGDTEIGIDTLLGYKYRMIKDIK